ncbi:MAG: hypothetical protein NTV01_14260 [Bacteroidia bacterium]|nr:hypothetical protein [Bacteroidia bacterium]
MKAYVPIGKVDLISRMFGYDDHMSTQLLAELITDFFFRQAGILILLNNPRRNHDLFLVSHHIPAIQVDF